MSRVSILSAAALAALLAVGRQASAQIVFSDNFEGQADGNTASVYQGGTPNDPGNGDADPTAAAIGTWDAVGDSPPWFAQVSTATNGPTTGPAGGTGKYLTLHRENGGPIDVRGRFSTPAAATDKLSYQFDIALSQGDMQTFVRGTNGGAFVGSGFTFLPAYVNLMLDGSVNVNGTVSNNVFTPGGYETVKLDLDMAAQQVTVSVNGVSAANMTNRPFLEPVTTLNQFSFYVIDTGTAGFDNVSATLVPEPASFGALALGGGLLGLRRGVRRW